MAVHYLDAGDVRSRDQHAILGDSNPSPDFDGSVPPATIFILFAAGTRRGHGQAQMALSIYSARSLRLRRDRDTHSRRPVYQGKLRKLLVEANRNGFIYVLDRSMDNFFLPLPSSIS